MRRLRRAQRLFLLLLLFVPEANAQQAAPACPALTDGDAGNRAYKERRGRLPEHRIGRNDILRITVWNGSVLEEKTIRVAEDGTLFVPFGVNRNISIEGCTSSELKQAIHSRMELYFRSPQVQVVIEQYKSKKAYLLGEIRIGTGRGPGLWPLGGKKTVLEFITENGGFTQQANIVNVQLKRSSGDILKLNLSEVIFQGDESQNPVVDDGDIIWVPGKELGGNTYYVFGEVRNPGIVTSDKQITLVDALSRAGSLDRDASKRGVYLLRSDGENPLLFKADLKKLLTQGDLSQNYDLHNGDIIYVSRSGGAKVRRALQTVAPLVGTVSDAILLGEVLRNNR